MKPSFKYYFADEPQFSTIVGRAYLANYFRSLRNVQNGNKKAYSIYKNGSGWSVKRNYPGSPCVVLERIPAL